MLKNRMSESVVSFYQCISVQNHERHVRANGKRGEALQELAQPLCSHVDKKSFLTS